MSSTVTVARIAIVVFLVQAAWALHNGAVMTDDCSSVG